jgi:hypothetical protein
LGLFGAALTSRPPPARAIALPQIINNPSSIINAEASSARIGFVFSPAVLV